MSILSVDKVQTTTNSYNIVLSQNFEGLDECLKDLDSFTSIFIITEKHIAELYLLDLDQELKKQGLSFSTIFMQGREKNKHIRQTGKIYNQLIEKKADRKSLIFALGGGVVGDFAGFIASTFLRGIRFIQIPTTLLAAVDSSVGGKVAVNADLGKNMIGSFHQPDLVFAPLYTLNSLPTKEWKCGLAEVLKHSLLAGGEFFEKMKKITLVNYKKIDNIKFYIRESVAYKASIVSQDPKEKGLRAVLNLGHTVGHAIESYLQYKKLTHGESVSIGLISALLLSEKIFGLTKEIREYVLWIMKNLSLPYKTDIEPKEILKHMKYDKKNTFGEIHYVLLKELGEPVFGQKINENLILEVLAEQQQI